MSEWIQKILKPILDDEYKKGFDAGVSAEKLVKDEEREKREYDLLCRGAEIERQRIYKDLETKIEEITAKEFEELAEIDKEPFGFVGTLDDLSLVIDGEVV